MSIAAVYGKQRRGKSLFATFYGLHLAEQYQKKLVTNFPLIPDNVAKYCRLMGYKWLPKAIEKGALCFVPTRQTEDLINLFKQKNTVIVADEMAVYLPSRGSTYNTPIELREAIVQVGHDFQHLIYIAQNPEQVDTALRSQAEEVFQCNGMLKYSAALKNDALVWKSTHRMEPDSYQVWLSDPKIRRNPLKVKLLASKSWLGFLSCADLFQFQLYDSFTKLTKQQTTESRYSLGLHYEKANKWLYVSQGNNCELQRVHLFSKLITWAFRNLPGCCLLRLLKWDEKLSRFKGLNRLEKRILQIGIPAVVVMVLGVL